MSPLSRQPFPDITGLNLGLPVPDACDGGAGQQDGNGTLDLVKQVAELPQDSYEFRSAKYGNNYHDWTIAIEFSSLKISGSWVCHQKCCDEVPTARFTGTYEATVSNLLASISGVIKSDFTVDAISKVALSGEKIAITVKADGASRSIQRWIQQTLDSSVVVQPIIASLNSQADSPQVRAELADMINQLLAQG